MASKAQHRARAEQIIACLNLHHTRATYGAVAQLLGLPTVAINHQLLGPPRPEASWIVSQDDGQPRGYSQDNIHSDLPGSPMVTTAHEPLQLLLQQFMCCGDHWAARKLSLIHISEPTRPY